MFNILVLAPGLFSLLITAAIFLFELDIVYYLLVDFIMLIRCCAVIIDPP